MNDGDAVSDDVADVKVHKITKVDNGVESTLEKYL